MASLVVAGAGKLAFPQAAANAISELLSRQAAFPTSVVRLFAALEVWSGPDDEVVRIRAAR
ncbi:MAG: hypothetical protein QM582_18485 [Micropruina sp.]|uniref:hypothetical protein n=1 Tax=Micropruina sp. TaxID=2737536 RepID=UPI0039E5EABF